MKRSRLGPRKSLMLMPLKDVVMKKTSVRLPMWLKLRVWKHSRIIKPDCDDCWYISEDPMSSSPVAPKFWTCR